MIWQEGRSVGQPVNIFPLNKKNKVKMYRLYTQYTIFWERVRDLWYQARTEHSLGIRIPKQRSGGRPNGFFVCCRPYIPELVEGQSALLYTYTIVLFYSISTVRWNTGEGTSKSLPVDMRFGILKDIKKMLPLPNTDTDHHTRPLIIVARNVRCIKNKTKSSHRLTPILMGTRPNSTAPSQDLS